MEAKPKGKITVVHLITLLEFGGAQGNTIFTVQNLDPAKFEAHLWSGKRAFWDEEVKKNIGETGRLKFFSTIVRPIHPFFDLLAIWTLSRELKKLNPQILHTHSSKAGILGRFAGWLAGVPIIIHTYHGFGFNNQQNWPMRWLFITLERMTARISKKLIFVSEANLEQAKKLKIGKPGQYELIRSGISLKVFKSGEPPSDIPNLRRELGIPAGCPIILTVGPFKPQKNLFQFLELAGQISKQFPLAHFAMVGDGALRKRLEERIGEMNLSDKVHLPGWRKDILRILSISKVFILTSLWEGLPRALVEAMATGIPAVCFETDGVKDLLSKGGGTMVRQGDIQAAARAVIRLLSNPSDWREASNQAKEIITDEFDIEQMVKQQEKLYGELIGCELEVRT